MTISWQIKTFYKFLHVLHQLMPHQIDVKSVRNLLNTVARLNRLNRKFKVERISAHHVPGEWIFTADSNDTIIFYLHGGAYFLGSTSLYHHMLARLAKSTKAKIFAIDYRLAPEHPFPAALEDAITAYQWLIENNHSPQQIIIAGDSAGGGLTIATLVALRDRELPLSRAAILLSPWLDLALTGESLHSNAKRDYFINPSLAAQAAKLYLNSAVPTTPLASPLYAELHQLPPIYIQVGSAEILLSDSMRFAEKAKTAGTKVSLDIWPDMIHGWHFFGGLFPESSKAIRNIADFVQTYSN